MMFFDSDKESREKRQPAVAGRFYPAQREALVRDVESHMERNAKKIPALGIVVPHAGFMYSGDVAGAVYSTGNWQTLFARKRLWRNRTLLRTGSSIPWRPNYRFCNILKKNFKLFLFAS